MILKYKLDFKQMGSIFMGVPYGENAPKLFIRLNETGKEIVKMLEKETTYDEIIQSLLDEYEVDVKTASESLDELLAELRACDFLCE